MDDLMTDRNRMTSPPRILARNNACLPCRSGFLSWTLLGNLEDDYPADNDVALFVFLVLSDRGRRRVFQTKHRGIPLYSLALTLAVRDVMHDDRPVQIAHDVILVCEKRLVYIRAWSQLPRSSPVDGTPTYWRNMSSRRLSLKRLLAETNIAVRFLAIVWWGGIKRISGVILGDSVSPYALGTKISWVH